MYEGASVFMRPSLARTRPSSIGRSVVSGRWMVGDFRVRIQLFTDVPRIAAWLPWTSMGSLNRYAAAAWARRRPAADAAAAALIVAVTTATSDAGSGRYFGPARVAYFAWDPPLWLAVPVGLLAGVAAWQRRRHPLPLAAVALTSYVLLSAYVVVVFAQYTLAERTTSWRKAAANSLGAAMVVGVPIWKVGGPDAAVPLCLAICVGPALLSLYVGTRRELIARIRERAERAEREQHQRVMRAQRRTRPDRQGHA